MAIKKCVAVQLGVIHDSQVTNRKKGEPPSSCHTPSRPEYTKTPLQTGRSFYFLIEKLPKTVFLNKTFNKI
jgi:hypothetical protein